MYDPDYTQTAVDYHVDFPLLFAPLMYISFVCSINLQSFYQEICDGLAKHLNEGKIYGFEPVQSLYNKTIIKTNKYDNWN